MSGEDELGLLRSYPAVGHCVVNLSVSMLIVWPLCLFLTYSVGAHGLLTTRQACPLVSLPVVFPLFCASLGLVLSLFFVFYM